MARVLLVGTATLDLVFELDHYPGPDEEMRARRLRTCRGGNAANSAVVLAGLGHQPEFLGVLADVPETAVIEDDFKARGVGYACCPRLPGRPPTSSIYLAEGCRSIVHYRDLPELDADHFMALALDAYDWVHFEGRNTPQLLKMLHHAKAVRPGLPISLELEKPRDGIAAAYALSNYLICSRGYARHCLHESPDTFLEWMVGQAPHATVVVAWGEQGAFGAGSDGRMLHAPAMPPAQVVDTLGAGDTFNAAFIDAILNGCSLPAVLQHACRLAGEKCGRHGVALNGRI